MPDHNLLNCEWITLVVELDHIQPRAKINGVCWAANAVPELIPRKPWRPNNLVRRSCARVSRPRTPSRPQVPPAPILTRITQAWRTRHRAQQTHRQRDLATDNPARHAIHTTRRHFAPGVRRANSATPAAPLRDPLLR